MIITVVAIVVLGFALTLRPSSQPQTRSDSLRFNDLVRLRPRPSMATAAQAAEVQTRFAQGVTMLQMGQYDYALTAFHQVLKLAPQLPEAHVNMGFALIGLERWRDAASFFDTAIELRRDQMNAYYGLAVALEGQGDLRSAMGAMQTYVHRAKGDDPFRDSAEAALAKWRDRLRPEMSVSVAPPATAAESR
ncbi:MAG TPA: tetratricopeptide repeat protein [Aromatoleum sp.]|uniref:tetratricopeptide repeat protein n=1 Tax=Aromatoleum sp. TaxID=2307007 RepID=UPI002B46425B|nr:tetratricopeptide repeat protein [Aromatoleum sp.]HJV25464.1 tetratricopeptide repeat protein [Aromatoleum sp.]